MAQFSFTISLQYSKLQFVTTSFNVWYPGSIISEKKKRGLKPLREKG
jgi:hypothetical protein